MALRFLQSAIKEATPTARLGNVALVHTMDKIGNREIVGFGWNGTCCYQDWAKMPFPSIRFRETTPEIQALREKEKGDWKNLDVHEKKTLYRATFCQTFSEFQTRDKVWKRAIGFACIAVSTGIWLCFLSKAYVYDALPDTYSEDRRKAQLKRILDLQVNPIRGVSSKWDYENNKWKK